MPTRKSPRKGSLQFWPRKRAKKFLPRVNWDYVNSDAISSKIGSPKGFIGYKAGMVSLSVKDDTPDSLTKGKVKMISGTVIECPPMRILSVRFYKYGKVMTEILSENIDKEIKKKIKVPKEKTRKKVEEIKDYDDIRIVFASSVKKTNVKKTPDLLEIGLVGEVNDKLNFIKENAGKDISASSIFENGNLVDLIGLTKGQGLSGPVKRFGITLKGHKSEKGRRRPGSLGPWHPARVTFKVPQAGQLGMFTRKVENGKIVDIGSNNESLKSIKKFGDIKTEYIIVAGSVQGPSKRQLIITPAARPSKKQFKKKYELLKIIR